MEVANRAKPEKPRRPNAASRAGRNAKTTHVFFHDKYLKAIPKIKEPTQAVYAYFHNNEITKIEGLELMYNLTHLQLQWNKITAIQGLSKLYKLKKLYLGNNCISVVENLEGLRCLEELHLEKQTTDSADGLCFEPRSLVDIGANLRLLNVSDNKISHIDWIKPLRRLEILIAGNNRLEDFNEVANALCSLMNLVNVDFAGNPMTKKHRYKETMIARCSQLSVLDGDTISSVSRTFLRGFDKACRLKQLNERNRLPLNSEGADDFFELNMLGGPRARSAYSLQPTALPNTFGAVRATDSSYSFVPRAPPRRHRPPPPAAVERAPGDAALPPPRAAPPAWTLGLGALPAPPRPRDARPAAAPFAAVPGSEEAKAPRAVEPSPPTQPLKAPAKPKGILKKPMPMRYA